MKRIELQAFLRIAHFATVEKVGRVWGKEDSVAEVVEEK
jgi:hypothetical protein